MTTYIRVHVPRSAAVTSATHPSGPHCGTPAALLLVAGMSPRPHRALPAHRIAARSGAFNHRG
ncbi:MAG TPA: hypothetical protein VJ608_01860 [Albitalea sp.]|nr:hypothetical protein [Albitalea sp.]